MRYRAFPSLLLLAGALTSAQGESGLLRAVTEFRSVAGTANYQLNDRFLFVGSDSVFVGDSLLGRDRYTLDYALGTIVFLTPLRDSLPVRVTYDHLPAGDLSNRYFLYSSPIESAPAAETSLVRTAPIAESAVTGPEELDLNGNKTITASVGSNGLGLDQSLRLNLKGKVAGIDLDAILSDQSAGIQSEGTTRELAELDKVLISFTSRNLKGSFGDFDYAQDYGRLGSITRRMRGAEVSATVPLGRAGSVPNRDTTPSSVPFGASYSKPKGRFGHNQFPGLDGKQGPYPLSGDVAGVTVVPGSEVVYLDGRLLVRGWDNDYTIDYSQAELTFTNRHQISARSRIEADFEYTTDEYDRATLAGGIAFNLGLGRIGFGAFSEGDDPNAHLEGGVSVADQALLAGAGSDTNLVLLPGADSVGLGKGDYFKNGDSFRFAGRDSGDFQVQFALAGDSSGDYEYDNALSAYRYVGPGNGRYVVGRLVRLPERGEAYYGDLALKPWSGVELTLTGALGRRNRNLFATGGPRTGLGYDGALSFEKERFGLSYERRELGHGFSFPGQIRERDLAYIWNLRQVPREYGQDQLSGFVKPIEPVKLDVGLGWLRAAESPPLDRKRGHLGVAAYFADYSLDRIGQLSRHSAGLAPKIGIFSPGIRVQFETDTARAFLALAPVLGARPNSDLDFRVSWQRNERSVRDTNRQWQGESRLSIYRGDAHVTVIRNLDVQAILGFERRTALIGGAGDFDQLFANVVGNYSNPVGIHGSVNLDQKYELAIPKNEIFVRVEKGKGEFSQDSITREYYPDTLGDFVRRLVPSGARIPTRKTTATLTAGFATWRWLGLDLSAGLDQQASDTARLLDNRSGGVSVRLWPYDPAFSLTLADNISSNLDRLYAYAPEQDGQNRASAEMRFGGNEQFSGTGRIEVPVRRVTTPAGALKSYESGISGVVQPTIGFGLAIGLKAGYGVRNIELPWQYPNLKRFQLRTLTLGISRRFEFRARTALEVELNVERRTSDISHLPFEVSLSDPLGWAEQFTLSLDRMLSSVLVLSGNYSFLKRPDRRAEHSLTASLKANF